MASSRNIHIEYLRVWAMFGIVVFHCLLYGYDGVNHLPLNVHGILARLLNAICSVSVNVLVLICGYYTIGSRGGRFLKVRKLSKLYVVMWFYTVLFFVIGLLLRRIDLDLSVSHYLPLKSNVYWFMTEYIKLMMLSPFIVRGIEALRPRGYSVLLIIVFVLTVVLQIEGTNRGFSLLWFLFLFLLAGYLRKNEIQLLRMKSSLHVIFVCSVVFYVAQCIIKVSFINWLLPQGYTNIFMLLMSVCVFLSFMHREKVGPVEKIIAQCAPYTLGVYLIHEHPIVRTILWTTMQERFPQINVLIVLTVSLFVFLLCLGGDWIRQRLFCLLRVNDGIEKIIGRMGLLKILTHLR